MSVLIRKATRGDLVHLSEIAMEVHRQHVQALSQVFSEITDPSVVRDTMLDLINNHHGVLLAAEVEDQVVGYLCARVVQSAEYAGMAPRRFVNVDNVGVLRSMRGRGIGRALMAGAEAWAVQKGVLEMQLNVWEFNEGAVRLYERLGYSPASRKMWKKLK